MGDGIAGEADGEFEFWELEEFADGGEVFVAVKSSRWGSSNGGVLEEGGVEEGSEGLAFLGGGLVFVGRWHEAVAADFEDFFPKVALVGIGPVDVCGFEVDVAFG